MFGALVRRLPAPPPLPRLSRSLCTTATDSSSSSEDSAAPFVVAAIDDVKGRGLVTTAAFRAGDIVWQEMPAAVVADPSLSVCATCLSALPMQDASCVRCSSRYCSEECRALDWHTSHEIICAAHDNISQLVKDHSRQAPALTTQMIARSLNVGMETYWPLVESLCALPEEYDLGPDVEAMFVQEYASIKKHMGESMKGDVTELFDNVLSAEWYSALMGILRLNTFRIPVPVEQYGGLDKGDGDGLGATALFIALSLVNHSCIPNTNVTFGRFGEVTLTAVRDIPESEEITITYGDPELPVEARQESLVQRFGFNCKCPKCLQQLEEAMQESKSDL